MREFLWTPYRAILDLEQQLCLIQKRYYVLSFNVIDQGQTILIEEAKVAVITKQGFWIKDYSEGKFIPRH